MVRGRLVERIKRTAGIESFRFIPDENLEFVPGQFLRVLFDENDLNNKELNKYLSFSSSPAKEYIEVTKRLSRSRFSEKLRSLKLEDKVLFKAPIGNCVFKDDYKKIGFLIGGIGITPVISIIEFIVENKLNTEVTLVYSNRTEEEIAFRKELDDWAAANSNIKVYYTVTDCEPRDKGCIPGRITRELLSDKVTDIKDRRIFVFGPPRMVEAIKGLCLEAGASKEKLMAEGFVGY